MRAKAFASMYWHTATDYARDKIRNTIGMYAHAFPGLTKLRIPERGVPKSLVLEINKQIGSDSFISTPCHVAEIHDDVRALIKLGAIIHTNTDGHVELRLPTQRIMVDGIDFGEYWLAVPAWRVISSLLVYPKKDNISADGYIHPHVGLSHSLCAGNVSHAVYWSLASGLLYGAFDMGVRVLGTYSPVNPYKRIAHFIRGTCSSCGQEVDSTVLIACPSCRATICVDCHRIHGVCESCL